MVMDHIKKIIVPKSVLLNDLNSELAIVYVLAKIKSYLLKVHT